MSWRYESASDTKEEKPMLGEEGGEENEERRKEKY